MTTVVLIADPPVEGAGDCSDVVSRTPIPENDGPVLYRAVLKDVFSALAESTVDVLVNYPSPEDVPDSADLDRSPETILRGIAGAVVDPDRLEDFRFEVQVGSDFSAKAGNAITHLLDSEDRTSAAVLRPCVPRLVRSVLDEASIKLRRTEVVLGPAGNGEVYYAGFTEPIDFTDVFEDRPLEEIAGRAGESGMRVDFLRNRGVLGSETDLTSEITRVRAERLAGKQVPSHFAAFVADRGLSVDDGEIVETT